MWRNNSTRYGIIARLLHWLMVPLLVGLIIMGLWMTSLTYYDPWYHKAPFIHEGLGVLAFVLFLLRLIWRLLDPPPLLVSSMRAWEKRVAHLTHISLYLLMGIIPITGYLMTTAKGLPVQIFGWFSVPALFPKRPGMEDLAGEIHLIVGLALAGLAFAHLAAALKHHFFDKDETLLKMVGSLPPTFSDPHTTV